MPIIERMLTLNEAHLTPETKGALEVMADWKNRVRPTHGLVVYPKLKFGWFMYLEDDELDMAALRRDLPDLHACVAYARAFQCQVLCIDRDGQKTPDLPLYPDKPNTAKGASSR